MYHRQKEICHSYCTGFLDIRKEKSTTRFSKSNLCAGLILQESPFTVFSLSYTTVFHNLKIYSKHSQKHLLQHHLNIEREQSIMDNKWEYDYTSLYREQSPQDQNKEVPPVWEVAGKPVAPKKKWLKKVVAGVAALAVCAGVGTASGYFGYRLAAKNTETNPNTVGPVLYQSVDRTSTSTGDSNGMGISDVVSAVASSVVEITTEQMVTDSYFTQRVKSGAGSGVIISQDGYVITNNHVIAGASHIVVTLHDKSKYDAVLIGTDPSTDVAILKIDATDLQAAVMGDSSKLAVGETAIAIGNPLGSLGGTVTNGIISALDRDITVEGQTMRLLQTNAAISPGNSGGGLFNANGELIGIVNAKSGATDSEGLGFAIPINTAKKVAEDLISAGYVTGRPALGVTVINILDAQTAIRYGMTTLGVYIAEVNPGSGAEKAGVQVGDRIVIIDGKEVSQNVDVSNALKDKKIGDVVNLQVAREGRIISIDVELTEQSQAAQQPKG